MVVGLHRLIQYAFFLKTIRVKFHQPDVRVRGTRQTAFHRASSAGARQNVAGVRLVRRPNRRLPY